MNFLESVHESHVAGRRVRVLASHLSDLLPRGATVLDVGCGDGEIASLVLHTRPDLQLTGVDVLVRDNTRIPVQSFDGRHLPFEDGAFDVVLFVDVLHHCLWPVHLLQEARRVARTALVIKDHRLQGFAARSTLCLMDWVGNRRYGVTLPYNYLRPDEWQSTFDELGLVVDEYREQLGIYCWPLTLAFDRRLHFMARLSICQRTSASSFQDWRPARETDRQATAVVHEPLASASYSTL